MKKYLLIIFVLIFNCHILKSEDYKILKMNMPSILIGDRFYSIGDTFSDNMTIHWSNEMQAIKAQNLSNKEISLFVAKKFNEGDCKNIQDYFNLFKNLSTRGTSNISYFSEQMTDTFYIFDTIAIETPINFDKECYPYIAYENEDKIIITRKLNTNGKIMYITTDDLVRENSTYINPPIRLYYRNRNKSYLISKSLQIIILSDTLSITK